MSELERSVLRSVGAAIVTGSGIIRFLVTFLLPPSYENGMQAMLGLTIFGFGLYLLGRD